MHLSVRKEVREMYSSNNWLPILVYLELPFMKFRFFIKICWFCTLCLKCASLLLLGIHYIFLNSLWLWNLRCEYNVYECRYVYSSYINSKSHFSFYIGCINENTRFIGIDCFNSLYKWLSPHNSCSSEK